MSDSVARLAFAVLLAASKKTAQFRIRPDGVDYVVEHCIDEQTTEEMRAPDAVLAAVIRRLSVMANLPTYAKGESPSGLIHLEVGADRTMFFAVLVTGHGPTLALEGRVITAAEYRAGG